MVVGDSDGVVSRARGSSHVYKGSSEFWLVLGERNMRIGLRHWSCNVRELENKNARGHPPQNQDFKT